MRPDPRQHAREWAEGISEKTSGSVDIQATFNGALVSIPDTMNAVVDGVIDIGVLGISYVSGLEPAFGYTGLLGGMPTENPLTEDALIQIWPQVRATLAPYGVTAFWGKLPALRALFVLTVTLTQSMIGKGKKFALAII